MQLARAVADLREPALEERRGGGAAIRLRLRRHEAEDPVRERDAGAVRARIELAGQLAQGIGDVEMMGELAERHAVFRSLLYFAFDGAERLLEREARLHPLGPAERRSE